MNFGLVIIEVCDANLACTDDVFALEELFPGVSVMENACMSLCERCAAGPYAYINGQIIEAESVPSLVQLLRDQIETTLEDYDTDNEIS